MITTPVLILIQWVIMYQYMVELCYRILYSWLNDLCDNIGKYRIRILLMQIKWSSRLRNQQAELEKNTVTRQQKQLGTWICALSNTPLSILKTWKITISKMHIWAFVGICSAQAAARHNFVDGDWSNNGHQHYAFAQNGYVKSHSQKDNEKKAAFNFRQGDTLTFEFNSENFIMKVSDIQKNQQYKFDIDPKIDLNAYFPCVYLHAIDDSFTIFC